MRFFVAILMAAIVSHAAGAATNSWTSIGPYGGQALTVAYNRTSPSVVYLTSVGGFSRSTDGGVTWQMVFTDSMNSPVDLAVDPSNPDRVYVVYVNPPFLMSSSDAGQTLTPVANFPVNLVNPYRVQVGADGQTLYVTAGTRIVCSTDRGQSWGERTVVDPDSSRRVLELIIDPVDSNTLYAGVYANDGSNGIYVTHDGARTWTQSFWSTSNQHYVKGFAINSLDPGTIWAATYDGVWVSHDRAVTWSRSNFSAYTGYAAETVATDPHNPAVLYAATPWGLIKKSTDGGASWADVTGNNYVVDPLTLAVHPSTTGTLLVGGVGGVWGTTNDGLSWSPQIHGLVAHDILHFSASPATDRIYFNTNGSLVGYVPGGSSSATPINEDAIHQLVPNSAYQGSGAYQANSILSQPGPNGNLYVSLFNGLAISPDGGNSWTLEPVTGSGSQQLQRMLTWPGLPQTILAAGNAVAYRSIDGGNLWSVVSSGLPTGTTFTSLLTAASDSTIAYGMPYVFGVNATAYGLYRTNDSGLTWAPVGTGSEAGFHPAAIDPKDARILYAADNSDFLKSTDGGLTFQALNWDEPMQGLPYTVAIDPVHTNIVYAGTVIRISRSVDAGASWQVLPASPAAPTGSYWITTDIIVDPQRPSDVLVGTGRNGIFKMTVAPDLALSLQTSGSLVYGYPFTYQYKARNKGPYDATGVHVVVNLPGGIQNPSVTSSDGTCTVSSGVADCTVPVLRTGAAFTASISAVAPTVAAAVQISGNLTGDQPDADGTDNSILTQTQVSDGADLSVAANAPASAQTGQPISFSFTVTNSGPGSASGVALTYQAGAGTTVSAASPSAGSCTISSSGLVSCRLGDLAAGKSTTVAVTATTVAAGTVTATATVVSDTPDPLTANGAVSSSISVSASASGGGSSGTTGGGSGTDNGDKGGGGGGWVEPYLLLMLSLALIVRHAGRRSEA
jgi:uncharacterized repeat protein (TIGR01451 family)